MEERQAGKYVPVSPVAFLARANAMYGERTSVVYGETSFTWRQTYDRCRRVASYLISHGDGLGKNDVISVLARNVPAMYELHFAVPMAGAVLNTIDTGVDAKGLATILRDSRAKYLLVDYKLQHLVDEARSTRVDAHAHAPFPTVVVIMDEEPSGGFFPSGALEYEELVACGDPAMELPPLADDGDAVTLDYDHDTCKGVLTSHRSAYRSTASLLASWVGGGSTSVYLWTLPMFHCDARTFTWGMAARGGVNVCIRARDNNMIHSAIARHGVTHMCCTPGDGLLNILLQLLDVGAADDASLPAETANNKRRLAAPVHILTTAPPPATCTVLLERVERMGFRVTCASVAISGEQARRRAMPRL